MAKINLNIPAIGLDGKEAEGTNIGQTLAAVLAMSNAGDPLKYMHWAKKLYAGEELELDPSDLNTLQDFVLNCQQLTNLFKAQVLENTK
jgi:hypothetical protein